MQKTGMSFIVDGRGRSLAGYFAENRPYVLAQLAAHGSVLLQDFAPLNVSSFRDGLARLVDEFLEAQGEHTRAGSETHVFNPVRYSPDRKLLWHNENSFNSSWPHLIAFGFVRPADQGGESLLADSRRMLACLDRSVVDEFEAKGVRYIRRLGLGIDRHWKDIFATDSAAEAEKRCVAQNCAFRWLGRDVLETECTRSATVLHPATGEACWFNQVPHWHWRCLQAEVKRDLMAILGEDRMPRDCRFGDGSVIPDAVVDHILETYQSLELAVACRQGDVLIVDNLAVAHGRNPYQGTRDVLVAMGVLHAERS